MAANKETIRHGNATIRPAPNGRGFDCCMWDGNKQRRARLPSLPAAKIWCEAQDDATDRVLTASDLSDAARALSLLPEGVTLTELVDFYLARRPATNETLSQAGLVYLTECRSHITRGTFDGYRSSINRLIRSTKDKKLADILKPDIEAILTQTSPYAWNNHLNHLSTFFEWCIRTKRVGENPTKDIRKARVAEPPKKIYTVEEAERLLLTAAENDPALIPYIAIGLFAGLRPYEIFKLDPTTDIKSEYILLSAKNTKTREARTVKIHDNLHAWLKAYPPGDSLYSGLPMTGISIRLRKLAALSNTPKSHDIMRHSYASYSYELTKNAAAVAAEMGHRGTSVFFRHYRGLVHPGDGKLYFSIVPHFNNELTTN